MREVRVNPKGPGCSKGRLSSLRFMRSNADSVLSVERYTTVLAGMASLLLTDKPNFSVPCAKCQSTRMRVGTSQPVSLGQLWSVHQYSEDWWFNPGLLQSAHHLALGKILIPKFTLRSSHHCINGYILLISWRDRIVYVQCVIDSVVVTVIY